MAVFIFLYKLETKIVLSFLLFRAYQTSFWCLEIENGPWKQKTNKKNSYPTQPKLLLDQSPNNSIAVTTLDLLPASLLNPQNQIPHCHKYDSEIQIFLNQLICQQLFCWTFGWDFSFLGGYLIKAACLCCWNIKNKIKLFSVGN